MFNWLYNFDDLSKLTSLYMQVKQWNWKSLFIVYFKLCKHIHSYTYYCIMSCTLCCKLFLIYFPEGETFVNILCTTLLRQATIYLLKFNWQCHRSSKNTYILSTEVCFQRYFNLYWFCRVYCGFLFPSIYLVLVVNNRMW